MSLNNFRGKGNQYWCTAVGWCFDVQITDANTYTAHAKYLHIHTHLPLNLLTGVIWCWSGFRSPSIHCHSVKRLIIGWLLASTAYQELLFRLSYRHGDWINYLDLVLAFLSSELCTLWVKSSVFTWFATVKIENHYYYWFLYSALNTKVLKALYIKNMQNKLHTYYSYNIHDIVPTQATVIICNHIECVELLLSNYKVHK